MEINIFLPINVKLGWLNNVSGLHLVVFSLLLTSQQGLERFFRRQPFLPIGWSILQTVRQQQEKVTPCEAPKASQ
jgi:hypothetical protein